MRAASGESRRISENPNIELARRLLAAFEAGDEEAVQELIHPAHRGHATTGRSSGPEGVRQSIRWLRETFADRRIVAEDLIASDDRVVARVRFTAIELSDLHGLPPPARRVEASHVHIWRVAEGRLAEHWLVQDTFTSTSKENP